MELDSRKNKLVRELKNNVPLTPFYQKRPEERGACTMYK